MKVDIVVMPAEDAVQYALAHYDAPPKSHDPGKLYRRTPIDVRALDPADQPKQHTQGSLVQIRLGELLGLGVIGWYYRHFDGKLWDLVVGVEDSWKRNSEAILSDGQLRQHGQRTGMVVQQVLAQDYHSDQRDRSIRPINELLVSNICDKENKRGDFPDKCALVASVFSDDPSGIDVSAVMRECKMDAFQVYFVIVYSLPELDRCTVYYLEKGRSSFEVQNASRSVVLVRHKNPYTNTDQSLLVSS